MNTHLFGAGDPSAAALRRQRQADAQAAREKRDAALKAETEDT